MAPFTVPGVVVVKRRGAVAAWPKRQRASAAAIDGDAVIRWLTAAVVLAVATFAAVVSYSHIYDLAHRHGQDGTAARLLPLSIDGLIAAASLVMLHASRNRLPVPRLARAMLTTGVAATVAANMLYAIPPQWIGPAWSTVIGAAISAFPAVAFIGSVEMMVRFVRDARLASARDDDDGQDDGSEAITGAPPIASEPAPEDGTATVTPAVSATAPGPSPRPSRQPSKRMSGRDRAAAVIKKDGTLTDAEVARRAKVSESTARRARALGGEPSVTASR